MPLWPTPISDAPYESLRSKSLAASPPVPVCTLALPPKVPPMQGVNTQSAAAGDGSTANATADNETALINFLKDIHFSVRAVQARLHTFIQRFADRTAR